MNISVDFIKIQTVFALSVITMVLLVSCNKAPTKESVRKDLDKFKMEGFEFTYELAHPNAKRLLTEDFYWSPIEETGLFGNDDGSDAFQGFREWRVINANVSPLIYVEELLISWDYPMFDLYEMDVSKIRDYISAKTVIEGSENLAETSLLIEQFKKMAKDAGKEFDEKEFKEMMSSVSSNMGGTFLLGQDNVVIAVGFGQFALEGKIDEDIKKLTKTAINRELLPILINRWGDEYKETRVSQLNDMLIVVDKMND